MTESPQGSALAVTHNLKTTNASVCVDGCLTSVEKILSNEENSKDLKGRGRNLLMLILEKSWQKVVKTSKRTQFGQPAQMGASISRGYFE